MSGGGEMVFLAPVAAAAGVVLVAGVGIVVVGAGVGLGVEIAAEGAVEAADILVHTAEAAIDHLKGQYDLAVLERGRG